jgi:hypothetical protein
LKGILHWSLVSFAIKEKFEKQVVIENATIKLVDVSVNEIFRDCTKFKEAIKIYNQFWQRIMNIKEKIEECESVLKQIKQFDPDPYYVNYFFNSYLFSANKVYLGIFEEANRDFRLFISGKYNREIFLEKAREKIRELTMWV